MLYETIKRIFMGIRMILLQVKPLKLTKKMSLKEQNNLLLIKI